MNFDFEICQNIIFKGLNPQKNRDKKDIIYKSLLASIPKQFYAFQPLYNNDFEKPLTPKTKYYVSLIQNEAVTYLNTCVAGIESAITLNEKKYLLRNFVSHFSLHLRDLYGFLYRNQINRQSIEPSLLNDDILEDETYIFQYLKTELIRIYLEVTERFEAFKGELDIYDEGEIYKLIFKVKQPSPSLFSEADKITTAAASKINIPKEMPTFNAIKNDIREPMKGVLDFNTIIKDSNYFALFEIELFEAGYITHEYIFNDSQRGFKNNLACIYVTLIKKGYFHKRDFKSKKSIKESDIRKFLDHRYKSNLDKQFRTYLNSQNLVANFIAITYWLDKLPAL